jgi:hypothetical protein
LNYLEVKKSMKNIYLYQKLGYQEFKRSAISDSLTRVYLEEDRIKYLKLMIAYFALFKYYPLLIYVIFSILFYQWN